jgi:hypothetical protein
MPVALLLGVTCRLVEGWVDGGNYSEGCQHHGVFQYDTTEIYTNCKPQRENGMR